MPRTRTLILALVAAGVLAAPAPVIAAANPSGSGQPNASCEETASAPAGFSSPGFAIAEEHYAGEGPGAAHADNSHAVSQYDVACFQVSQH